MSKDTGLPSFRYFPDPIGQGAIVAQPTTCVSCGQQRDYSYSGPVYGLATVEAEELCPWCIADGSAAAKFDIDFLDTAEIAHLDKNVQTVLTTQTPCYTGWQQEIWKSHCNDGCAFLGRVGAEELASLPSEAAEALRHALRDWGRSDEEREQMFGWLQKDGDLTGYLFRCLHCGAYTAHVDSS